jgi:DNA-binding transcriptional regulator LsrR (DeoR family)
MKLRGRAAATRAFFAFHRGDVPGIIRYSRQALEYLPEQDLTWRSAATNVLGDAYDFKDEMAAAHQAGLEELEVSKAAGNIYQIMIANLKLAIILRHQGRLQQVIEMGNPSANHLTILFVCAIIGLCTNSQYCTIVQPIKEPMNSHTNPRLIVKICKQYFEDELTQQEIADTLRISRSTVSRILSKARDEQIVHISIEVPAGLFPELERALEHKFDLVEAVVVETFNYDSPFGVARELGEVAASYLERTIRPHDIIGFAWGTTMKSLVDNLRSKTVPDVQVVQLNGGLTPHLTDLHATVLTRDMAARLGGECYILQAPGVVDDPHTQQMLMADPQVTQVFELAAQANLAFIGIGNISAESLWGRAGLLTEEVTSELKSLGAVGDVMSRYFDKDGVLVNSSLCRRVVGLPIEKLRPIPRRVGVAGGKNKFEAILAALRGKYVNILITDHLTAQKLVDRGNGASTDQSIESAE